MSLESIISSYLIGFQIPPVTHYNETSVILDRIYLLAYFQACNRFTLGNRDILIDKVIDIYKSDKYSKPTIGKNNVDTVTCSNFNLLFEEAIRLAQVTRIRQGFVITIIAKGYYDRTKELVRYSQFPELRRGKMKKLFIRLLDKYLGYPVPKVTSGTNKTEITNRIVSLVSFRLRTINSKRVKDELTLRVRRGYLDALDRPMEPYLGSCASSRVTTTKFNDYFDDVVWVAHFAGIKIDKLMKLIDETISKESKRK